MKSVLLDANVIDVLTVLNIFSLIDKDILEKSKVKVSCAIDLRKLQSAEQKYIPVKCVYQANNKTIKEIDIESHVAELNFIIQQLQQPINILVVVENGQKLAEPITLHIPEIKDFVEKLKDMIESFTKRKEIKVIQQEIDTRYIKDFYEKIKKEIENIPERYTSPEVMVYAKSITNYYFTSLIDLLLENIEKNTEYFSLSLLKESSQKTYKKFIEKLGGAPEFTTYVKLAEHSLWNKSLKEVLDREGIRILLDPLAVYLTGKIPFIISLRISKLVNSDEEYLNKLLEIVKFVVDRCKIDLPISYAEPDLKFTYEIESEKVAKLTRYGTIKLGVEKIVADIVRENGKLYLYVNGKPIKDWVITLLGVSSSSILGALDEIRKKLVGKLKIRVSKISINKLIKEGGLDEWLSGIAEKNKLISLDRSVFSEVKAESYL